MNNIKNGDILVCRRDYTFNPDKGPTFFKHKKYRVDEIIDFDYIATATTYLNEHNNTYIIGGNKISWYFLEIIFYNKKEERKYKLKKLKKHEKI